MLSRRTLGFIQGYLPRGQAQFSEPQSSEKQPNKRRKGLEPAGRVNSKGGLKPFASPLPLRTRQGGSIRVLSSMFAFPWAVTQQRRNRTEPAGESTPTRRSQALASPVPSVHASEAPEVTNRGLPQILPFPSPLHRFCSPSPVDPQPLLYSPDHYPCCCHSAQLPRLHEPSHLPSRWLRSRVSPFASWLVGWCLLELQLQSNRQPLHAPTSLSCDFGDASK